jgi:hypothetical protein
MIDIRIPPGAPKPNFWNWRPCEARRGTNFEKPLLSQFFLQIPLGVLVLTDFVDVKNYLGHLTLATLYKFRH